MSRPVPFVNFPAQFAEERDEIMAAVEGVFARGEFVGGPDVALLESELAAAIAVPHVVAVNSGTDALILGMRALGLGPGDEVITPPNSFVASTSAIVAVGATPVFADVLPDQTIDPERVAAAITPRTRAVMVVHLTGRIADMDAIGAVARRHGLFVIEDAAQSMGSRYRDRMSGAFGDIGCFSAHPLKNLNAAGDAGFITTPHDQVAEKARLYRTIGLKDRNTVVEWGTVSRLDTLQAAILRLRLRRLPSVIERRRRNAALYRARLDPAHVFAPPCLDHEFNTFHTFVVQVERRDDLQRFLTGRGIGTGVHYPVPIHLQPVARALGHGPGSFPVTEAQAGRILSLPIHQFLDEDDIATVCDAIAAFHATGTEG
ncbi:MAG: DegT/DnrJ/EryC1/StrS family aminotransferase [Alphaproteobacteria bacterium]